MSEVVTRERLIKEVYGPDPTEAQKREPLENVLWAIGDLRRRTADAHSYLDTLGAQRTQGGGVLTLRGRIQNLAERGLIR